MHFSGGEDESKTMEEVNQDVLSGLIRLIDEFMKEALKGTSIIDSTPFSCLVNYYPFFCRMKMEHSLSPLTILLESETML